jgi:hypothetical protein
MGLSRDALSILATRFRVFNLATSSLRRLSLIDVAIICRKTFPRYKTWIFEAARARRRAHMSGRARRASRRCKSSAAASRAALAALIFGMSSSLASFGFAR